MARGRGEVHGFTVPAINIRAQTFDMARTIFETRPRAPMSGAVIFELARSEQTYTFQRPDRLLDRRPRRRDRRGLAGAGVHPGRPLPVQRQEVRGRPGGDDRGDPAGVPARDRGRLPQHRHRLLDARRPVEADRRRAAARELPPRRRAHRAHPDRSRRDGRHRQRRRRDRRGRQAELHGRGAARVPRRLSRASWSGARRARSASRRSASRRARATAASRCRTAAWPRSSSTSRCSRELGEVARDVRPGRRRPARRVDAARRAVPPLPGGRDGGDPPRDRLPERCSTSTRRSRRSSIDGSSAWCYENAADERKPDQTDQQFVYTTRKKAIGPFKRRALGPGPRTRSSPRSAARSRSCSPSSASTGRARWSTAYVRPVEVHRRSRTRCARLPPPASRLAATSAAATACRRASPYEDRRHHVREGYDRHDRRPRSDPDDAADAHRDELAGRLAGAVLAHTRPPGRLPRRPARSLSSARRWRRGDRAGAGEARRHRSPLRTGVARAPGRRRPSSMSTT